MFTYEVYGITYTFDYSSYAYLDSDPAYRDCTIIARDSDDNEYMGTFHGMGEFRRTYPGAEIVSAQQDGDTLRVWC